MIVLTITTVKAIMIALTSISLITVILPFIIITIFTVLIVFTPQIVRFPVMHINLACYHGT